MQIQQGYAMAYLFAVSWWKLPSAIILGGVLIWLAKLYVEDANKTIARSLPRKRFSLVGHDQPANYMIVSSPAVMMGAMVLLNGMGMDPKLAIACGMALMFPIVGVAAYFLLRKDPAMWFNCPHCSMRLSSHEEWKCGACKFENRVGEKFKSYLKKCARCGDEPSGYICPQCGEQIALCEASTSNHVARSLNAPVKQSSPVESPQGETDEERLERERRMAEKEAAKVDAEAKRDRSQIIGHKIKLEKESVLNPPPPPPPAPKKTVAQKWAEKHLKRTVLPIVAKDLYLNSPEFLALPPEVQEKLRENADMEFDPEQMRIPVELDDD